MNSTYDLDFCIQRISEGQKYTRGLFQLIYKLEWTLGDKKLEQEDVDGIRMLEYVERMVYED